MLKHSIDIIGDIYQPKIATAVSLILATLCYSLTLAFLGYTINENVLNRKLNSVTYAGFQNNANPPINENIDLKLDIDFSDYQKCKYYYIINDDVENKFPFVTNITIKNNITFYNKNYQGNYYELSIYSECKQDKFSMLNIYDKVNYTANFTYEKSSFDYFNFGKPIGKSEFKDSISVYLVDLVEKKYEKDPNKTIPPRN